jgi:hypothetical protein
MLNQIPIMFGKCGDGVGSWWVEIGGSPMNPLEAPHAFGGPIRYKTPAATTIVAHAEPPQNSREMCHGPHLTKSRFGHSLGSEPLFLTRLVQAMYDIGKQRMVGSFEID